MKIQVQLSSDSKVDMIQKFINDIQNDNIKFYIDENQQIKMEWGISLNLAY
jgi:hypothetical protein